MQFTADQVWGLAVKADALNEGYIKEAQWGPSDSGEDRKIKEANKATRSPLRERSLRAVRFATASTH